MAFPLRTGILALLVVAAAPAVIVAQRATMPRAFELERRGNYEAAADAYREVLRRAPGDVSALRFSGSSTRSRPRSACCCR